MKPRRYDAYDNLLYKAMRFYEQHGSPPRKVSLPIDEAHLLVQCKHSGVFTLDELMTDGVAGLHVEIVNDPDAKILLS